MSVCEGACSHDMAITNWQYHLMACYHYSKGADIELGSAIDAWWAELWREGWRDKRRECDRRRGGIREEKELEMRQTKKDSG